LIFYHKPVEDWLRLCYDDWRKADMEINVLIDKDFTGCLEESWLQGIVEQILVAQEAGSDVELGLFIASQERVQELNRNYRGKDEPTDVLAFSAREEIEVDFPPFVMPPDGISHLGEVIISYPQAAIQAEEHQHSIKREIIILIIHGVLHLLGYEHDKPELERVMRAIEAEILSHIRQES
jgi:probable rRNA maturation factor